MTSNEFVIQGIIKEAFFNETQFQFQTELSSHQLVISDLLEGKIRDRSSNKRICFHSKSDATFNLGSNYTFQARFHRYTIKGTICFEGEQNGILLFTFPDELILENLRKSERSAVRSSEAKAVPVFLRSHSLHCEGSFTLEDTSHQGFGGKILVPSQFPIEIGSQISGQLGFNEEIGKLNGEIVSASLANESQSGFDCYRIGIGQTLKPKERVSADRRSQARHSANLQMTLESLLHPGQTLVLDVDDISVNGFSGVPSAGSVISSVPVGASFKLAGEKTKVRLIHFSKERLHFQIFRRTDVEGIAWIKKMTPFVHPGARCTTKDAKELYRIFLQAGAVSQQYLKRHMIHNDLLVDKDENSISESSCFHRWFIGGTESLADSYISAMRFGNSCWVLGDIAKANGTETDAGSSVKKFFNSFSEFALSDSSIGTLMIFWLKGHPMWREWYGRLQSELKQFVCSEVKMQYFRITSVKTSQSNDIECSIIEKENYQKRTEILNSLSQNVKSVLTYAFDFDEPGVGSFSLKQASNSFDRSYLIVETKNYKYLAIVNRVQFGISINRFTESLFLFPLEIKSPLSGLEQETTSIAQNLAADLGVVFPSVRVVYDQNLDLGETEMTCLLLYPRAFLSF